MISRRLQFFHRARRATTPLPAPHLSDVPSPTSTLASMTTFAHHTADYLGIRRMHLLRATEAFEYSLTAWLTLARFAHVTGDWHPQGTDAASTLVPDVYGGRGSMCAGHYLPLGQRVTASDAAALAKGIRRALVEMPRGPEFRDGGQVRRHAINDRRLFENANDAGAHLVVWAHVVDLDIDRGDGARVADFLERGACELRYGRPEYALRQEERAKQRRERCVPLEQEQERLLTAVQTGTIAADLAAPRLAAIRQKLQAFTDEERQAVALTT